MTDQNAIIPSEGYFKPATEAPDFVPARDWSHPAMQPFAKVFGNIADTVVKASQLSAQVEALQHTVDTLQATLQDLMQERSHLRADLREVKTENAALRDQVAQQQSQLDYERDTVVRLTRESDDWQSKFNALTVEHNQAKDDRDLAHMERDDWKEKHGKVSIDFEALTTDLSNSRSQWFKQEDELQRQIRDLTSERNSYRDKFDAAKSFAAKVMAMDQVKPQPIASDEAIH